MSLPYSPEHSSRYQYDQVFDVWKHFLRDPTEFLQWRGHMENFYLEALNFLGIKLDATSLEQPVAVDSQEFAIPGMLSREEVQATYFHSITVALYAKKVGQFHHAFGEREVREQGLAALLHDVGKYFGDIRGLLMNYEEVGTERFAQARLMHPIVGAQLLRNVGFSERICGAVEQHHDNHLGKDGGVTHPEGMNPYAAIIRYCDCLASAITQNEAKRRNGISPGLSHDVMKRIMQQIGTKYDPRFRAAFLEFMDWWYK